MAITNHERAGKALNMLCDCKKRVSQALPHNWLVRSWLEVTRLVCAGGRSAATLPAQAELL